MNIIFSLDLIQLVSQVWLVCLMDVKVLIHLIYPHLIQVVFNIWMYFFWCSSFSSLNLSAFITSSVTIWDLCLVDVVVWAHLVYPHLIQVVLEIWVWCFMDVVVLVHLTYPHLIQVVLQVRLVCLRYVPV